MSEAEIETIISIIAIAISMFTIGLNIGFDKGMAAGLRRLRERDLDADHHRPRVLGGYRGVIGEPGDPPGLSRVLDSDHRDEADRFVPAMASFQSGYVIAVPGPGTIDLTCYSGIEDKVFVAVHFTGETKRFDDENAATAWLLEKAQAAVAAGEILNSDRED